KQKAIRNKGRRNPSATRTIATLASAERIGILSSHKRWAEKEPRVPEWARTHLYALQLFSPTQGHTSTLFSSSDQHKNTPLRSSSQHKDTPLRSSSQHKDTPLR